MPCKRTAWRRAKLMLPVVVWALLGGSACTRDTEADRRLDKLNSFVSNGGHVVVKARLLRSDALEQEATDFVDLSAKSDLIMALLLPAYTADDLSGYPEICQVQVAENEEATPTVFHIQWLGIGPALYSVSGSPHRYKRGMSYMPARQDMLDEALSLCGFVKAAVAGDKARQADVEEALRLCLGLDKPKE